MNIPGVSEIVTLMRELPATSAQIIDRLDTLIEQMKVTNEHLEQIRTNTNRY